MIRQSKKRKAKAAFAFIILAALFKIIKNKNRRRQRRFWVRPFLQKRLESTTSLISLSNLDDEGLKREEMIRRGFFKSFLRFQYNDFRMLL